MPCPQRDVAQNNKTTGASGIGAWQQPHLPDMPDITGAAKRKMEIHANVRWILKSCKHCTVKHHWLLFVALGIADC